MILTACLLLCFPLQWLGFWSYHQCSGELGVSVSKCYELKHAVPNACFPTHLAKILTMHVKCPETFFTLWSKAIRLAEQMIPTMMKWQVYSVVNLKKKLSFLKAFSKQKLSGQSPKQNDKGWQIRETVLGIVQMLLSITYMKTLLSF